MNLPEENAFRYVCEYLIKKCIEMHTCESCTNYVNENKTFLDNKSFLYCFFRDCNNTEENSFGNYI